MQNDQHLYRVAQKSKPLPSDQKIVLKPVNEIRFIRQIKVSVKHYIRWYSMRDLLSDLNNYALPANWRYASYTVNYVIASSGVS